VWTRSYSLEPGGHVEIANVNGRIDVEGFPGITLVEVRAERTARGTTNEAAKSALKQLDIREEASPDLVRVQTKIPGGADRRLFDVHYIVKVPVWAHVRIFTVDGEMSVTNLKGALKATTTNGAFVGRALSGDGLEVSVTNGRIDVEVNDVGEHGVNLETTNGGVRFAPPNWIKATLTAMSANGNVSIDGLPIRSSTPPTRHRLEGTLNGGGPPVRVQTTTGDIRIGTP
jgi:hypothetical protein